MPAEPIHIQARIAADPATAWTCYTDPEHIVQWNFASPQWCCPRAENDLAVGGRYMARMEARDGSMGFDFVAMYTAVDPGNSFTYRLDDGREVSVRFTPEDDHTVVDVAFDPEGQNPRDVQQAGWQAILLNYKRHTEAQVRQAP